MNKRELFSKDFKISSKVEGYTYLYANNLDFAFDISLTAPDKYNLGWCLFVEIKIPWLFNFCLNIIQLKELDI